MGGSKVGQGDLSDRGCCNGPEESMVLVPEQKWP